MAICKLCKNNCEIGNGKLSFCGVRVDYENKTDRQNELSLNTVEPIHFTSKSSTENEKFVKEINIISEKISNLSGYSKLLTKSRVFHVKKVRINNAIIKNNYDRLLNQPLALFITGWGCSLRCQFCSFWDSALFAVVGSREYGREKANELLMKIGEEINPQQIINYCIKNNIEYLWFGGNEPIVMIETYIEVLVLAKHFGIKVIFETNGNLSTEAENIISPYIDTYIIKLKSFSEKFYAKNCKGQLNDVLETIKCISQTDSKLIVSYPLIPDENDSENEVKRMVSYIKSIDVRIHIHFERFYPDYRMLDKCASTNEKLIEFEKYS